MQRLTILFDLYHSKKDIMMMGQIRLELEVLYDKSRQAQANVKGHFELHNDTMSQEHRSNSKLWK